MAVPLKVSTPVPEFHRPVMPKALVRLSTSWLLWWLAEIATVAPDKLTLSVSDTDSAASMAVAASFSV